MISRLLYLGIVAAALTILSGHAFANDSALKSLAGQLASRLNEGGSSTGGYAATLGGGAMRSLELKGIYKTSGKTRLFKVTSVGQIQTPTAPWIAMDSSGRILPKYRARAQQFSANLQIARQFVQKQPAPRLNSFTRR